MFNRETIESIDWVNSGKALKKLPILQSLWTSKWAANYVTLGQIRKRRDPSADPTCPHCGYEEDEPEEDQAEDQAHFLSCGAVAVAVAWNKWKADLEEWPIKSKM